MFSLRKTRYDWYMFYTSLLTAHIAVACITGVAASYAGIVLWRRDETSYSPSAIVLAFLAGLEIISGTILSIASPKITAVSLCANIVVYLFVVFLVETLLFLRMKKISMAFPLVKTISPSIAGLLLLVGAIAYGF